MKYEYDSESDGLFMWFENHKIETEKELVNELWPSELQGNIGILFDKNWKIKGFEILLASKYFDKDTFEMIKNNNDF